MTLKDIAEAAGVSCSTVSRVINSAGNNFASAEVRSRIWRIVRESGYTPNKVAQNLRKGGGESFEIPTVHILFARLKDDENDSYFRELATYVQEEILSSGARVGNFYLGKDVKKAIQDKIKIPKTDGLVVLGRVHQSFAAFVSLFNKRVIYVTLNQMHIEADHVMCDGIEASHIALKHLHDNGHRRIAYVGEYPKEIRYRTFVGFLDKENIEYSRETIINATMTFEGGFAAAQKLMFCKVMPTAVFCANDVTAIGLLRGLREKGFSVPKDISVISIDDITEASEAYPRLTTVKIPLKELGGFAVKTLLDRINKGHSISVSIFMPAKLLIRDSVGKNMAVLD